MGFDELVEDVRVPPFEPRDLRGQTAARFGHQLAVPIVPELCLARTRVRDLCARSLDEVLAERLGIGRRQIAVPEDRHDPINRNWYARPGAGSASFLAQPGDLVRTTIASFTNGLEQ